MKLKTNFVCQECGAVYARHQGQCYHCNAWNTIIEEIIDTKEIQPGLSLPSDSKPMALNQISLEQVERITTGITEFDRVAGGGIVPGSLILIGGSPGIGKSTLLLSAADMIASQSKKVLYVTGEESLQQIKIRSDRLRIEQGSLFIMAEIDLNKITSSIIEEKPQLVIIDSIQTMMQPAIESAPGSVSQVRECAGVLQRFCKNLDIPIIVVGHITKSGGIAGPMVLEHIVDAVFLFEGENTRDFRILRALKNRFGSTQEIGVFVMESRGLRGVENPSEFFLTHRENEVSGTVICPITEGSRPLLIEVQALVSQSGYGLPARRSEGFSTNRLTLLLAVLEKRGKLSLGGSDVFINMVGGVNVDEPGADLAIILAITSSLRDKPIPPKTVIVGEVGLGGEIRGVNRIEERIGEASRMGFEQIILPSVNITQNLVNKNMELIPVEDLSEAIKRVF
ncbi:MAG: DNA repair protein RadA [Vulcanimicrobiota bacterium]